MLQRLILSFVLIANAATAAPLLLVSEPNPPFEIEGKDGAAAGLAVDIVSELMRALGVDHTIKLYPWPRCIEMVKRGDADGIFYIYRTPERDEFLSFPDEALFDNQMVFFVAAGAKVDFGGEFQRLRGKRIGVVQNKSYGPDFDRAKTNVPLTTEAADDIESSFKKLIAQRIDLVVSNRISAWHSLREAKLTAKVQEISPFVQVSPAYLAFTKKKDFGDLMKRIDEALRKLKRTDAIKAILDRYGSVN